MQEARDLIESHEIRTGLLSLAASLAAYSAQQLSSDLIVNGFAKLSYSLWPQV